jgi:ISXO2-like transposase domain/Transposase zinc-ribbon domain
MSTASPGTASPAAVSTRRYKRPQAKSYLLKESYRRIGLPEIYALGEEAACEYLMKARWGDLGDDRQACPSCGAVDRHYRFEDQWVWKCRETICATHFTLFSGTPLHGMKMSATVLLSILFQFVENKDSVSARTISGTHRQHYQTARCLIMKIREVLRTTMKAEPKLSGRIQADAAYFIRYLRPGNVGSGQSRAAQTKQKNAGLDEKGKTKAHEHSADMHALVVFVQEGAQGSRRYKVTVVKTEREADMELLADEFCERGAVISTDQLSNYFVLAGTWDHQFVNHTEEFMSKAGVHTNLAENYFSRMRACQAGAWHRLTVRFLEDYGWEVAWRLTMLPNSNEFQLQDLLARLMRSGRSTRFRDAWNKQRRKSKTPPDPSADQGPYLVEIPKDQVRKRRGPPRKGVTRVKPEAKEKRAYNRKTKAANEGKAAALPRGKTTSKAPALAADAVAKAGK